MLTKLASIAEVARSKPEEKFTSLVHLINEEMLGICHFEASSRKATGVDRVTKGEYEQNLVANLRNLVTRMKKHAYHPQPVRRVYIPKEGSNEKRPLGIPVYEDKLVQAALAKILNTIYEEDFLEFSYGFRPNRGCHDAIKSLNKIIGWDKVNFVVDADIKGFFQHVDHEWMKKFIQHRIADPNILRLITKFLKAGIMEEGQFHKTDEGTPQGGIVSPVLANIYLHYVIDLWFEKVVRKQCRGAAYMVRYADDSVFCFQFEDDAKSFYQAFVKRLSMFNLEVAEEKTKIIPFGRSVLKAAQKRGETKADTFDFLGFTHYCTRSLKGTFRVGHKTSRKKYKASLLRCKEWVKKNRHLPMHEMWKALRSKLQGYYRYYGITGNSRMVSNFFDEIKRVIFKWLNRRSQRKSFDWDKFQLYLKRFPLPRPRIYVNIYEFRVGLEVSL